MGTKFFGDELPVHKTTVDGWTTNIINALKGVPSGLAPLGVDGLIDVSYLPPVALSTSWGNIGGLISDQTDLTTLIGSKAGTDSPAFTGVPTAPTAPEGTNSIQIATTEFVHDVMRYKNRYNVIAGVSDGKTYNVSTQAGWTQGGTWSPDGWIFYIIDRTNDTVYQYWATTQWDISSLTYFSESFSVTTQDTNPVGIRFRPDGLKMYIIGYTSDAIHTYTLGTAWDITTAVYASTFSVASKDTSPQDLTFRPDGLKMYVCGDSTDRIYQYSLSVAWDVSTATYEKMTNSLNTMAGIVASYAIEFRPDGLKFWVYFTGKLSLYQFSCATAWDVSTATYDELVLQTVFGASGGFFCFGKNGTKLYGGGGGNIVTQYSIT